MPRPAAVLLILLLFSALAYGVELTLFRAQTQVDGVQLEWHADGAPSVRSYEVYRQDFPADDFDKLISLSPTAQPYYRYLDPHVDHTTAGGGPVMYRLAVRTATGLRTYHATPAPPEQNLLTRSWDTIKLMFR